MNIKQYQQKAHENSAVKGFWDCPVCNTYPCEPRCISPVNHAPEKLALIHSELSEALEALRGKEGNKCDKCAKESGCKKCGGTGELPHSRFEEEIADAVIRIFDLAEWYGSNLDDVILWKMNYNATRGYKHGKAF